VHLQKVFFFSGCLGAAYHNKVFSDSGIEIKANRESKEHSGVQAWMEQEAEERCREPQTDLEAGMEVRCAQRGMANSCTCQELGTPQDLGSTIVA
jgi:hypothetical protein